MSTAYLPTTNHGSEHIILRGAALIDGNGGDPVAGSEIEIKDGRIVYVGVQRNGEAASAGESNSAGEDKDSGGEGPCV
ncbi:MAG: hypothetical protein L0G69_06790, partial [Brevibacterium sp.]|nr:hypothetical protein [Brevibacterium sp.]